MCVVKTYGGCAHNSVLTLAWFLLQAHILVHSGSGCVCIACVVASHTIFTVREDGEVEPIHMLMIRLETVENHQMYCLMPSDDFIVKKSGTQARIKPTTFEVLGTELEVHLYRTWGYGTAHQYCTVIVPYVL